MKQLDFFLDVERHLKNVAKIEQTMKLRLIIYIYSFEELEI
jgi:hypothetical protein